MFTKSKRLNRKEARAIQLESQKHLPKSHLRSILEYDDHKCVAGHTPEQRLACIRASLELLSERRIRFEGNLTTFLKSI
ncbi:MAG: hypothetical protein CL489_07945 [Acidobacteria bacterium]|nr:hypothetical protein [Acidobacteriota bacterium]